MEEDLKILKFEFLSNHWSDFPQILNLSLWDQTKIKNAENKDDLKKFKLIISATTDQIFILFWT